MPGRVQRKPVHVTVFDRWLLRAILNVHSTPSFSFLLWNGDEVVSQGVKPQARVRIADRATIFKLLANPNLHFGDLYSTGCLEIEGDLVRFLEELYRAIEASEAPAGMAPSE